MGNTVEEASFGRVIRNSALDMLSLKYLLDVQVEKPEGSWIHETGFQREVLDGRAMRQLSVSYVDLKQCDWSILP